LGIIRIYGNGPPGGPHCQIEQGGRRIVPVESKLLLQSVRLLVDGRQPGKLRALPRLQGPKKRETEVRIENPT
jgi:hypothetical protein